MGERGRGGNITEIHLQGPTLCDGHVAKIKTDIAVPPLPEGEASGSVRGLLAGHGSPRCRLHLPRPLRYIRPQPRPEHLGGEPVHHLKAFSDAPQYESS